MKALFHHAFDVLECDGVYTPVRFTDRQLKTFDQLREVFGKRARYTSGVSLKIRTDAPQISFSYRAFIGIAKDNGFDIYENGILYKHEPIEKEDCAGTLIYRKETPGEVLLEIYLPSNAKVELWDLQLGAYKPVAREEKLVLFYGDSLTQSVYSPNPSIAFVPTVSRMTGVDYLNRGVGSLFYEEKTLDEQDTLKPWLIFVEFGANDLVKHDDNGKLILEDGKEAACTLEDIPWLMGKARAYLEKVRRIYPDSEIRVITLFHNFLNKSAQGKEVKRVYDQSLKQLCAQLSLEIVDGSKLLPHLEDCHVADRIHFSSLGGAHIAIGLAPYITQLLQHDGLE